MKRQRIAEKIGMVYTDYASCRQPLQGLKGLPIPPHKNRQPEQWFEARPPAAPQPASVLKRLYFDAHEQRTHFALNLEQGLGFSPADPAYVLSWASQFFVVVCRCIYNISEHLTETKWPQHCRQPA
jgi:hypothetical protein